MSLKNPLPIVPPFQRVQVIQVLVVGAICIMIGGLFWMVFTIAPSAIIDIQGVDSYSDDAQVTVQFMNAAIIAIPILTGIVVLAWGITRAIEERETGIESL